MNRSEWSRAAVVAILSAGVLPFVHATAQAADDPVTGEGGTVHSETKFKVSCGAFANGGTATTGFNGPVDDLFTNTATGVTNEMGIRAIFPKSAPAGQTFTYALDFDPIKITTDNFESGSGAKNNAISRATRMKLDVDIPKGTDFVSAELENVPDAISGSSSKFPNEIIRVNDKGVESQTGNHLRVALNNATEQRTTNGTVTNNGPKASGQDVGGMDRRQV
ncbi:hypothetical protein [Rhodococcus marinonascens]|uniref:hypothetical protein n=1 Tax=Rhodococcus marinonascens TaxID=38311 RepID=UPI0014743A53|nr:hypothetical protein [Rhodococcus marinonascens]